MKTDKFLKSLMPGRWYEKKDLLRQWKLCYGAAKGFAKYLKESNFVLDSSGLFYRIPLQKIETNKSENDSIEILAKSILSITLKETRKRLNKWIDENLDKKLSKYIADEIEKEFTDHVLPILLKKIDIHVKDAFAFNKEQVKKTMLEIAQNFVAANQKKG